MVAAAGTQSGPGREALESLCKAYWYPLYAFVRRRGYKPEDAQDLTQGFFEKLLENHSLGRADPEKGRFRSFLLASLKNFLANQWNREHRWKRGGRIRFVPCDEELAEDCYLRQADSNLPPDALFDRAWVYALLERSMDRLRHECEEAGKGRHFETLKVYLTEGERLPYAEVCGALGLSESAVKMAVLRLRRRFGRHLRNEIGQTVATPEEVAEEMRYLLAVLG